MEQAVYNGVFTIGVELSDSQKIALENEAGADISDALYSQGCYMQIKDPNAIARQGRDTPIANLWYCDGGSIQKITLNSTVLL